MFVACPSGRFNGWLFELLNHRTHITQAARALWIPQITGTLYGVYSYVDVFSYSSTFLRRSGAQIADRVMKAVAHEHICGSRLLLVYPLAYLLNRKSLVTVRREVYNRTGLCSAEKVLYIPYVAQTHR